MSQSVYFRCQASKKQNIHILISNWKQGHVSVFFSQLQHTKSTIKMYRAVFKWLSKVITWLRLLRLVIGLKDSRQFFSQWEAKPKPIAPCTGDFSRASRELQVIPRNSDWFMALFVPVMIGQSNCFGFGFSTVIWKPLYWIFCRHEVNGTCDYRINNVNLASRIEKKTYRSP